jgi:hypothetical protein
MGHVLDAMPPEKEVLTWLKSQSTYEPTVYEGLMSFLQADFRQNLLFLRTDAEALPRIRRVIPTTSTEAYKTEQQAWDKLDDDELIKVIAEPYAEFLDTVAKTLAGDMLYQQKCRRLDESVELLMEEAKSNPAIIFNWVQAARTIVGRYITSVRARARFHAMQAALEIYLIAAEKGQLPEALPDAAPKDPFSGDDFAYERTPAGFVLRCGIQPTEQEQPCEFKSNVQQANGSTP